MDSLRHFSAMYSCWPSWFLLDLQNKTSKVSGKNLTSVSMLTSPFQNHMTEVISQSVQSYGTQSQTKNNATSIQITLELMKTFADFAHLPSIFFTATFSKENV